MAKQFWRLDRVMAETGMSRSAIYEGMQAGTFPKSFKISERCIAWVSDEIEAWKAQRLAARSKSKEAA